MIASVCCGFVWNVEAADAPEAVAKRYLKARFDKDVETAMALTAEFPKVSKEKLKEKYAQPDDALVAALRPKTAPEVRNAKVDGDLAVVVCLEKPTDPDPVYMIQQEGSWRVLPEITIFNRTEYGFSADQLARFQELEKWYKEQKSAIRSKAKP